LGSKRQTTMAKLTRERKVKEKRELKEEKKAAAAAAKAAGTYSYDGEPVEAPVRNTTDPIDPADETLVADSTPVASSEDR
jgi:predicted pyridoxine 5'-phosphate oxidase superfamily flavin-nucleotide-binding protein